MQTIPSPFVEKGHQFLHPDIPSYPVRCMTKALMLKKRWKGYLRSKGSLLLKVSHYRILVYCPISLLFFPHFKQALSTSRWYSSVLDLCTPCFSFHAFSRPHATFDEYPVTTKGKIGINISFTQVFQFFRSPDEKRSKQNKQFYACIFHELLHLL